MRVGLVCPYDLGKPGGVQSQVKGLAASLPDHDVTIIGPGADFEGGIDLGGSVSVPGNRSNVPISLDPRLLMRVRRAVEGIDVLHIHEPLMPMASLAALRAGVPAVATFHADPGDLGVRVYNLLGGSLRSVLGRNVSVITAVSTTARRSLPESLDVKIVPNGVELVSLKAEADRVPGRVCFLGRDEPRKGLDILLDAWPGILRNCPGAELVVMGADRGTPGVDWRGFVDDDAKAEIMSASAVFVAPNTGGESFGIVLVEAMAAGTAVVASDLPAFKDVAGDAAEYFPVGDSHQLAGLVSDLLQDQSRRAALAGAAGDRIQRFDWAEVAKRYSDLYEEAVS